jgi:hypothetical protein
MPAPERKRALKRLKVDKNLQPFVEKSHRGWRAIKFMLIFLLWTTPLTILGLACMVTVIGAPLGVALVALGARPLATMVEDHVRRTM